MDKGQFPPPYPGLPLVQTNIPYQTQQVPYPTQPAPEGFHNQPSVIMPTITQDALSTSLAQVVVLQPQLTELPGEMKCLYCQQQIITETKYIIGMTAWYCCILIGALLVWPFCFIPLCLKTCKDVEHRCPNCKKIIHIYRRR